MKSCFQVKKKDEVKIRQTCQTSIKSIYLEENSSKALEINPEGGKVCETRLEFPHPICTWSTFNLLICLNTHSISGKFDHFLVIDDGVSVILKIKKNEHKFETES